MTGLDEEDMVIVNRICGSVALLAGIWSAIAIFASEPWSATALFTAVGGGMCVAGLTFIIKRAAIFVWALVLAPGAARPRRLHDRRRRSGIEAVEAEQVGV